MYGRPIQPESATGVATDTEARPPARPSPSSAFAACGWPTASSRPCAASTSRSTAARCSRSSGPTARARRRRSRSSRATASAPAARSRSSASIPQHAGSDWRERIGVVLQESELEPELTVRECLQLYAGYYRAPRPVEDTIALVGLSEKADSRGARLSGGQRRRLDVALALIGDPELVFLDEPTTGFDPSARRAAWEVIAGLHALGKTIFLTTHYMEEAEHLADRIASSPRARSSPRAPRRRSAGATPPAARSASRCPPASTPARCRQPSLRRSPTARPARWCSRATSRLRSSARSSAWALEHGHRPRRHRRPPPDARGHLPQADRAPAVSASAPRHRRPPAASRPGRWSFTSSATTCARFCATARAASSPSRCRSSSWSSSLGSSATGPCASRAGGSRSPPTTCPGLVALGIISASFVNLVISVTDAARVRRPQAPPRNARCPPGC